MHSSSTGPIQSNAVPQASESSSLDHQPKDQRTSPSPQDSQGPCSASSEQQLSVDNAGQVHSSVAGKDAQASSNAEQSSSLTDTSLSPDEADAYASSSDSNQQNAAISLEERKERWVIFVCPNVRSFQVFM